MVASSGSPAAASRRSVTRLAQTPPIPTVAPPLPVVETVATLGHVTEPSFILGHDKGQSTLYDNGAGTKFSYWSFGDTGIVRSPATGGDGSTYALGNTGAKVDDFNMSDNLTTGAWAYNTAPDGYPAAAFPLPPGYASSQYRVWGGSVVADPANHRMIGIYHLVQGTSTDAGYGVAIWTEATNAWTPVSIANATNPATPYVLWAGDGEAYNTGMVVTGGYLYAYGCFTGYRCKIARVLTSDTASASVSNRAAWTFYTQGGATGCTAGTWSPSASCAQLVPSAEVDDAGQPLGMLGGAAGTSVFWNAYLGSYMAVYTAPGRSDVRYAVAKDLVGPWSAPGVIAQGADPGVAGAIDYAGYAHPEFAEQNGKVQYVTFARALTGGLAGTSEFGLLKVQFGTAPATYQRRTTAEAYFADSGTQRINAAGPTGATAGAQAIDATAAWDRSGIIFSPGAAVSESAAVLKVQEQSSTNTASRAGLVMRNSIPLAHNVFNSSGGRGYVALLQAPGGSLALRWDTDDDQDLDASASVTGVSGAVWLRLTRTAATTYKGEYSTTSTNGVDGSWLPVGTATVASAAARQDAGMLSAGPDAAATNRTVFSGFAVLPGWTSTWAAAVSLDNGNPPNDAPPAYQAGFSNQTVRNIVHTSVGGSKVRVRLSNAFGTAALPVTKASVGLGIGGGADLTSVTPLTFSGSASVSIPAGQEVVSDPVTLSVPGDADLGINVYISGSSGTPTWHRYALRKSYVYAGDKTTTAAGTGYASPQPEAWYFVGAVDVLDGDGLGTVVALGDSITDGIGTSALNRWPDKLVDRLGATSRIAVINQGSAGAQAETTGPRVVRDVTSQSGARTVIIALGVNDLIDGSPISSSQIIRYYRSIASSARRAGIRTVVGTITPLGNNTVTTPGGNESIRQEVNTYLRSSTEFDAVVDFDAAIRDPANPTQITPAWAAAAGSVHPNYLGYIEMANKVDLATLVLPPRTR